MNKFFFESTPQKSFKMLWNRRYILPGSKNGEIPLTKPYFEQQQQQLILKSMITGAYVEMFDRCVFS